jgi:hypothetical protein
MLPEEKEEEGRRKEKPSLIKSKCPHLAGGDQNYVHKHKQQKNTI